VSQGSTWYSRSVRVTESVAESCVYLQINTIMASNFGASPWSLQAVSNLMIGAVSFITAWVLFGVCTRNPATEAASRGMLTRGRGMFRWFTPGRPWKNPFVWKDFHFVSGGVGLVLVRVALYGGLFLVSWLLTQMGWGGGGGSGQLFWRPVFGLYLMLMLFAVTLEAALVGSRVLHEEVRGQTLAALVMLPESVSFVIYSKFFGALLAAVPGPLFLFAAAGLSSYGHEHVKDFLDEAAGWFFLAHFVVVPHLSVALALWLRWGAVPLAIAGGIASLVGWVAFFEANHIGRQHSEVWFGTIFTLAVCVACHFLVIRKVMRLAER
jgi:hypothetical protein